MFKLVVHRLSKLLEEPMEANHIFALSFVFIVSKRDLLLFSLTPTKIIKIYAITLREEQKIKAKIN